MNIALVILHADPMRGGAERYAIDLAGALARRGHHVALAATRFADPPAGVQLVELPVRGFTRVARYRRMLDALDAHLHQARYHIIHAMLPVRRCHVYHPHAGMAAASVAGRPLQTLLNPRRRVMASIEHRLLNSPHPPVVLCLSDYVKQSVLQHYPELPADRLATLFNAVDLDLFDPDVQHGGHKLRAAHGISPDDTVALIVAQDFARKGVPQAIAATRQLNARRAPGQPTLKLLIVGSGRHHSKADDPNIIFVGADRKIARYYAAADFFVLPTRHDPCSLVVLEALAMGLPVISTRFNGACEIMNNGIHGFVLDDPDDVIALSQAMHRLLDADLRARMSAACRQLRPRLSFAHHVDRLLQIYQACRVESHHGD